MNEGCPLSLLLSHMSSESIELQYNVDLMEYFSSGSKSKIAIIPHGNTWKLWLTRQYMKKIHVI